MCGTSTDGASLPFQQEESENPVDESKVNTKSPTSIKLIPVWIKLKSHITNNPVSGHITPHKHTFTRGLVLTRSLVREVLRE